MESSSHDSRVSELINVKDFAEKWQSYIGHIPVVTEGYQEEDEWIKKTMDISDGTFDELSAVCSLDTLKSSKDKTISRQCLYESFPDDLDLTSVRLQKVDVEKRKSSTEYKKVQQRKILSLTTHVLQWKDVERSKIPEEFHVDPSNVVLTVQVYRPFAETMSKSKMSIDHVYHVLGCQVLTELRDKIRCVADLQVAGDYSENPDLPVDTCARDLYKSALFYIEGTFYNDMRDPDCRDYSSVITDWAMDSNRGLGPYDSNVMENVKFEDLAVRLGKPYLYMHQGNCEHLLVISDIRMLHAHDAQDIREYPRMISRRVRPRTMCKVCCNSAARWVTTDDELAPENPCYFCDPCFRSLHYDENDIKVCEFQAYKYFDSHVVL